MQPVTGLPSVRNEGDRVIVDVAWEEADRIQARLKHRGIESTLCADPLLKQAYLEVRDGTNPAKVKEALKDS